MKANVILSKICLGQEASASQLGQQSVVTVEQDELSVKTAP